MTAGAVARIGVRAMTRGKRVVVPGLVSAAGAVLSGIAPRRLATWAAHRMVKSAL